MERRIVGALLASRTALRLVRIILSADEFAMKQMKGDAAQGGMVTDVWKS